MSTPTIEWVGGADGHLRLIDQTKLPAKTAVLDCDTVDDVWWAIKKLSVRGAPAIGIAAAYGVVLAAGDSHDSIKTACDHLATSRPTAVNLFWALDRMRQVADEASDADPSRAPVDRSPRDSRRRRRAMRGDWTARRRLAGANTTQSEWNLDPLQHRRARHRRRWHRARRAVRTASSRIRTRMSMPMKHDRCCKEVG